MTTTYIQKDKLLPRKKHGKLTRSEYLKINFLFTRWRNWLYYLTIGYVFTVIVWYFSGGVIKDFFFSVNKVIRESGANNLFVRNFVKIPVALSIFVSRGIISSVDGTVSSWLKSPFGQISYFINKSNMETWRADEIVKVLTEINENFKETFKKFGGSTILAEFTQITFILISGKISSEDGLTGVWKYIERYFQDFSQFNNIMTYSLIIPVCYAIWRTEKTARKLIENLEFEDD